MSDDKPTWEPYGLAALDLPVESGAARLRVPGGWLFAARQIGLCFVPDPPADVAELRALNAEMLEELKSALSTLETLAKEVDSCGYLNDDMFQESECTRIRAVIAKAEGAA